MPASSNQPDINIVDSVSTLQSALHDIAELPGFTIGPPAIFIDLEGIKLSRNGSISILSLYNVPKNTVYLIDVHTLGAAAFSTKYSSFSESIGDQQAVGDEPDVTGTTLKDVLQSPTITKVIFDVRNDSDALFSHYQISLDGVEDLQLMELASRQGSRARVNGLSRCVEYDSGISAGARAEWQRTKEVGTRLFAPERGGTYQVFNNRPLRADIVQYCAQDVILLPKLYDVYFGRFGAPDKLFWLTEVQNATQDRIKASQSAAYDPHSRNKVFGPWTDRYLQQAKEVWEEDTWNEQNQQDSARDCDGWEEDMIKNGEMF